ncbi:MAG: PAC2 family protein [Candidatus Bathyarchaeia archaeon]
MGRRSRPRRAKAMVLIEGGYFRLHRAPQGRDSTLIIGLGWDRGPCASAALLLANSIGAKLFAEYYSRFFPDQVIINPLGICNLPRYEFYEGELDGRAAIICVGNAEVAVEEPEAFYEVSSDVAGFAKEMGAKRAIILDSFPARGGEGGRIRYAVNTTLILDVPKGLGLIPIRNSRIPGSFGLLLGLLRFKGIPALGILVPVDPSAPEGQAQPLLLHLLNRLASAQWPSRDPRGRGP